MDRALPLVYRVVATFEAFTWAGLLVGMAFKYLGNGNETGVHVFGPLHGGAFVAYVVTTLVVAVRYRWSMRTTFVGLVAAVPPFCTLVFDRWAERRGYLAPTRATRTPATA